MKREFIYTVSGEIRVAAKTKALAEKQMADALKCMEWTLWNPRAVLRGERWDIVGEYDEGEWSI